MRVTVLLHVRDGINLRSINQVPAALLHVVVELSVVSQGENRGCWSKRQFTRENCASGVPASALGSRTFISSPSIYRAEKVALVCVIPLRCSALRMSSFPARRSTPWLDFRRVSCVLPSCGDFPSVLVSSARYLDASPGIDRSEISRYL